jgi:hypothetical protein
VEGWYCQVGVKYGRSGNHEANTSHRYPGWLVLGFWGNMTIMPALSHAEFPMSRSSPSCNLKNCGRYSGDLRGRLLWSYNHTIKSTLKQISCTSSSWFLLWTLRHLSSGVLHIKSTIVKSAEGYNQTGGYGGVSGPGNGGDARRCLQGLVSERILFIRIHRAGR